VVGSEGRRERSITLFVLVSAARIVERDENVTEVLLAQAAFATPPRAFRIGPAQLDKL